MIDYTALCFFRAFTDSERRTGSLAAESLIWGTLLKKKESLSLLEIVVHGVLLVDDPRAIFVIGVQPRLMVDGD